MRARRHRDEAEGENARVHQDLQNGGKVDQNHHRAGQGAGEAEAKLGKTQVSDRV